MREKSTCQAIGVVMDPTTIVWVEPDKSGGRSNSPFQLRRGEDLIYGEFHHASFDGGCTWHHVETQHDGTLISVGGPVEGELARYLDWVDGLERECADAYDHQYDFPVPPPRITPWYIV